MNLLAAWLDAHSTRTVVLPDWAWLIAYEFEGRHLLLKTVDRSRSGTSEPDARSVINAFAGRMSAPSIDLAFQVEDGTVVFSVDGSPFDPMALTNVLRGELGEGVLDASGAAKPVNVGPQVTSPFQLWQRQSLSSGLIAQDFDGWLDGGDLCAVEFKQVKRIDGWRPYRDDGPNFGSLLACMGTPSRLVVVAAPQGEEVGDETRVAPFLLERNVDGKAALHVEAATARELADWLDAGAARSEDAERLKPEDWKTWRR